jgi:hypothetical protein
MDRGKLAINDTRSGSTVDIPIKRNEYVEAKAFLNIKPKGLRYS